MAVTLVNIESGVLWGRDEGAASIVTKVINRHREPFINLSAGQVIDLKRTKLKDRLIIND